jgi:predicted RNase H-like nuclease (RuvC/YqgF family)
MKTDKARYQFTEKMQPMKVLAKGEKVILESGTLLADCIRGDVAEQIASALNNNTAVEQLKQRVKDLKYQATESHSKFMARESKIEDLEQKLADAEARVKELESNLEDEIKISRKISYQQDAIEWQNKWREVSEKIAAQEQEIEKLRCKFIGFLMSQIGLLKGSKSYQKVVDNLKAELKKQEHLTKAENGDANG